MHYILSMKTQLVREKEMAELLSVSDRTVRNWRAAGMIPYIRVGYCVLYDPQRVVDCLSKQFGRQSETEAREAIAGKVVAR
jgi:excisionase family DNA binding protein